MPRRKRKTDFKRGSDFDAYKIADEQARSKQNLKDFLEKDHHGHGVHQMRSTSFGIRDGADDRDYAAMFNQEYDKIVWQPEQDGSTTVAVQFAVSRSLAEVTKEFKGAERVRACLWPGFIYRFHRPLHRHVAGPFCNSKSKITGPLKRFLITGQTRMKFSGCQEPSPKS